MTTRRGVVGHRIAQCDYSNVLLLNIVRLGAALAELLPHCSFSDERRFPILYL